MLEKTMIQSGLGGSRVLVSEEAEQLDPESLLDDSFQSTQTAQIDIPLVVLTIAPPPGLEGLKVIGGLFEGLSSEQGGFSMELTVLFPIALELGYLAMMKDRTALSTLEIQAGKESSILDFQDFQLVSVQIDTPLSNRVKIKVLFKSYDNQ